MKKINIKDSEIKGKGIFALENIAEDEIICVVFKKNDVPPLSDSFAYKFTETFFGNYTNHSENPNTVLFENELGIVLKATENITTNTEITCDYNDMLNFCSQEIFDKKYKIQ